MLVELLDFCMMFTWILDCILDGMRAVYFVPTFHSLRVKYEKAENQQRPKPMAVYIKAPQFCIKTSSNQVDEMLIMTDYLSQTGF